MPIRSRCVTSAALGETHRILPDVVEYSEGECGILLTLR